VKIGLHVHTRERSPCAQSSAEQIIPAAIDSGLDALVISDHDTLVPPERLSQLNAKYSPFRVFGGVEVTLAGEHVLVIGVRDKLLERRWWNYADLHTFVQDQGGFLALAHPFRYDGRVDVDVDRFPPHALELYSRNTPRRSGPRIRALAARLDVPLLSNSDAHYAGDLGAYYNRLDGDPRDVEELVLLLKSGAFTPVAPHG
jgi:hypothetical protein